MATRMTINGVSTCTEAGTEKYERFQSGIGRRKRTLVQYDYRHTDGELFTCVKPTLDECRTARNKWLNAKQGKNVSRAMLKGLEKRKHNLEAKLEKVEHAIKSRTDDVVDFKQMGIDHIFIDESHYQNFYEFPKFRIKLLILILLHFNIVRIIY